MSSSSIEDSGFTSLVAISFLPTVTLLISPLRWVSLITVMAGVSLVGFSGSLIKDAVKETVGDLLSRALPELAGNRFADIPSPEPIEKPEATKVLIGKFPNSAAWDKW